MQRNCLGKLNGHREEDITAMDLNERKRKYAGWIKMAQDTVQWRYLASIVMNTQVQ
jgi:hypothetical protein